MSALEEHALRYERLSSIHLPTLLSIEEEAYPDPWTLGMFRQELTNDGSQFFVAFRDSTVAGYGGFWLVLDEAHITKVTVVQAYRGTGLGREVMEFLLRHASILGANTVRLEVREQNTVARALYRSLGFAEIGLRKGYYARTNETAVVMGKAITRGE